MAEMFRAAGGWAVVALLWIAPWLLGGLPLWAAGVIALCGLLASVFWLVGNVIVGRWPRVPTACILLMAGLLGLGWTVTWASRATYGGPRESFSAAASGATFGTVDARSSIEAMFPITAALAVMMAVADLCAATAWRRRFWISAVACGVTLSAYGLLERAAVVPGLIDRTAQGLPPFGPYRYHGVAGAYLNLVLPLSIAGAVVLARVGRRGAAIVATSAIAILVAGAFVNVSKAGMALAGVHLLVCPVACVAIVRPSRRLIRAIGLSLAAIFAGSTLLVAAAGRGQSFERWSEFIESLERGNGRVIMWGICLPMVADAGPFGYGPGTFKLLLPHTPHMDGRLYRNWIVTEHVPGGEVSHWSYACNDYLQGLIEWGWLGVALWAGLLLGGAVCAVRALRQRELSTADRSLLLAVTLSLVVLSAHAFVEWPLQLISIQAYIAALLGLAWSSGYWATPTTNKTCASC